VSRANVEIVKRGWEHFLATGEQPEEVIAPDFVWDMSTFRDLMGIQPHYEGVEGIRRFLQDWTEPFDDWQIDVEAFHDAGDRVVAVCRQRARSKTSGVPVDMTFAQVFTLRDGLETRMEMYADPDEALKAVGLAH
jgi:ketosteroid isomerase-like protein